MFLVELADKKNRPFRAIRCGHYNDDKSRVKLMTCGTIVDAAKATPMMRWYNFPERTNQGWVSKWYREDKSPFAPQVGTETQDRLYYNCPVLGSRVYYPPPNWYNRLTYGFVGRTYPMRFDMGNADEAAMYNKVIAVKAYKHAEKLLTASFETVSQNSIDAARRGANSGVTNF